MDKYETTVERKVWDNNLGKNILVRPDCDGLGLVEVDGGDDYGRIIVQPDHALAVAKAMIACANELNDVGAPPPSDND